MTGRETDIFGSRSLDGSHPFGSIKLRRIEAASQLSIFLVVQILVGHRPFARCQHTVQAPVKEDSELVVLKFLSRLEIFLCWLIMLRRENCRQFHILRRFRRCYRSGRCSSSGKCNSSSICSSSRKRRAAESE